MRRFKLVLVLALCVHVIVRAQNKYEREVRIRKSLFPKKGLNYISGKLEGARRIRFYKETDSAKISYAAKFKKDRLWYSIEFDKEGLLEDIEIVIKPLDIPNETYGKIESYLTNYFSKYRIRRLRQQYPVSENEPAAATIKNAFQNLMLPSINYKLVVSGKKATKFEQFEILFDSAGQFKALRKSLPPNYDHVLY